MLTAAALLVRRLPAWYVMSRVSLLESPLHYYITLLMILTTALRICGTGTGGGWLPAIPGDASAVGENRNMCPTIDCGGPNEPQKLSSIDQWLCSPSSCSVAHPCLWDVVDDPQERLNLGSDPKFAHVVMSLRELLVSLNVSVVPPYEPVKPANPEQLCRAFNGRGSRDGWPYFGPWWSPPTPPSLSAPPTH